MTKCPVCEKGTLRKGVVEEAMFGVPLGTFSAEICDRCGESFISEGSMRAIEERAKKAGVWGMAKNIKVVKSGNSLSVRIPAKMAQFLGLTEGKELMLYPDGKKKMILEIS